MNQKKRKKDRKKREKLKELVDLPLIFIYSVYNKEDYSSFKRCILDYPPPLSLSWHTTS